MKTLALAPPHERRDVFRVAAEQVGQDAGLIEKDFWVCWILERLFGLADIAPHLVFKGGTSLSKVYGVIERFSEDVDVSLSRDFLRPDAPDAAETPDMSKTRRRREIETLVASFHRAVAAAVLPRLREAVAAELGDTAAAGRLALDPGDAGTILFTYPEAVGDIAPYIRPVVKIEMGGRSDVWPTQEAAIVPYAAEALPQAFAQGAGTAVTVRALAVERTFWEKATLLHNEFYRPPEKRRGERISRHHYDLALLSRHPEIGPRSRARRDLLERVAAHKTLYYSDTWSRYAEALTGRMRLVPPAETHSGLRADYALMGSMFLSTPPSFDAILEELARLEAEVNAAATAAGGVDTADSAASGGGGGGD